MAIRIGKKDITAIHIGRKAVSAVYKGAVLVWSAVRSCFGNGHWDGDKPWDSNDSWKND